MAYLRRLLISLLLVPGMVHAGAVRMVAEGKPSGNYAIAVDTVNTRVGIATGTPQATLDVLGNAQFGSGVNKSTFTASPGNGTYALQLSSGITLAAGPINLSAGGFIRYADGTVSTTAVTSGGGGGSGIVATDSPTASGFWQFTATVAINNLTMQGPWGMGLAHGFNHMVTSAVFSATGDQTITIPPRYLGQPILVEYSISRNGCTGCANGWQVNGNTVAGNYIFGTNGNQGSTAKTYFSDVLGYFDLGLTDGGFNGAKIDGNFEFTPYANAVGTTTYHGSWRYEGNSGFASLEAHGDFHSEAMTSVVFAIFSQGTQTGSWKLYVKEGL